MTIPIDIDKIIEEMEMQSDAHSSYLNRETGEILMIPEEHFDVAENDEDLSDYPDWEQEMIEAARDVLESDKYLQLPTQFDIHEYRIMEDFCHSLEDDEMRHSMLRAIRGRGAFRYFKDSIHRFGIREDWFRFREEAFKQIAIDWCEENDIPYTENSKREG